MARGEDQFGLVVDVDGRRRPSWATASDELRRYFDDEWGVPVRDDAGVFERISLEVFQAGLSWATILHRRPGFRDAFDGFDPELVAAYGDGDVERLLADDRIIRNRRKIVATITNARTTLELASDGGLAELVWSYVPERRIVAKGSVEVPAAIPESKALADHLKRRGFTMVGPVNICAAMCAIGVVDVRGESGVWSPPAHN